MGHYRGRDNRRARASRRRRNDRAVSRRHAQRLCDFILEVTPRAFASFARALERAAAAIAAWSAELPPLEEVLAAHQRRVALGEMTAELAVAGESLAGEDPLAVGALAEPLTADELLRLADDGCPHHHD